MKGSIAAKMMISKGQSAATGSSESPDDSWSEGYYMKLVAVGIFIVSFVLIVGEVVKSTSSRGQTKPTQAFSTAQRRFVQALALWQIVVCQAEANFMVPFVFDFAKALHGAWTSATGDALFSGFIQGGSPAGYVLGAIAAYSSYRLQSYKVTRALVTLSPLLGAGAYLSFGYVLLSNPASPHLVYLVVPLRLVTGFCLGFGIVPVSFARQITPKYEQIAFSLMQYMAMSGGLAIGPLMSASVVPSAPSQPGQGIYGQEVRAICAIASLLLALSCCTALIMPRQQPQEAVPDHDDGGEGGQATEDEAWSRLVLATGGACVFAGIFASTAVEVSSSLLLELQYGWAAPAIGRAIAAVFGAATVLCAVVVSLQPHLDSSFLIKASFVGIVGGALLLFDIGGGATSQLLFADVLAYPCITGLVAIVDGFLFMEKQTTLSTQGLTLAVYIIHGMARASAAPLVRGLIGKFGRNNYASLQLDVALLLVASATALSWLPRSEQEGKKQNCKSLIPGK